ncbi:MAG: ADP-forming succinate--CoA ligase subunit beta [Planctomycetota bacterium]
MKIHEYQAKGILARYGVPVPEGRVAHAAPEAMDIAKELGGEVWVVKAQIHAGGRGKGGGVELCRSLIAVQKAAQKILGMRLVTHQTGPKGQVVEKVLIEKGCPIDRELYLGLVLDRQKEIPVLMGSARGGMDIETVAAQEPEALFFEEVDPTLGLQPFQGRRMAARLELPNANIQEFSRLAVRLVKAYLQEDCSLAEINPLVLTKEGQLTALDAKLNFDDNALYRHEEHAELRDFAEEDPLEVRASQYDLSYINMDGTIGCMVNGAGLAMATMDIIKIHGGEPANFLDVGGSATADRVSEAFRIILSDDNVRSILVNIFGGIVRCDLIASGVVQAAREIESEVPLVVRLEGNMVAEGKAILAQSGLNIIPANDLEDAAKKAVAAAGEGAS